MSFFRQLAERYKERAGGYTRDQADRRIIGAVAVRGDIALAGIDRQFHVEIDPVVKGADHMVGVENLDIGIG